MSLIIVYRIVFIMQSLLFNESLFFSLFNTRIMGLLIRNNGSIDGNNGLSF